MEFASPLQVHFLEKRRLRKSCIHMAFRYKILTLAATVAVQGSQSLPKIHMALDVL